MLCPQAEQKAAEAMKKVEELMTAWVPGWLSDRYQQVCPGHFNHDNMSLAALHMKILHNKFCCMILILHIATAY